ncbi:MAG TPA: prolyl oligopeptidase family serine peptidase [Candidatus Cybelea sp.]|jgi:dipeptidyl aminopeptidase/acylaminoacyl peptidase|nr:prolyl oligopeptidase family serine peptidase [Candidatus Cybelea sp.]
MLIAAFSLAQILSYPFPSAPVRDAKGTAIAYTLDTQGVRTLWFARAPGYSPVQLFSSNADDGQELSDLAIAGDLAHVVYVRGGDHDANWALPLQPGPDLMPQQPLMQVWSVSTAASTALRVPKLLGEGDAPEISPDGSRVAFTNGGAVMVAPVDGSAPAKRLFFDRGQDSELHWSPDGSALAFVSARTDHSFIGIYRNDTTPLEFVAPSTSQDFMPRWSPDGASIAFVRIGGDGGAPQNPLNWNPTPWQIWVGGVKSAAARMVWASGSGGRDSLPQTGLGPFLEWVAGNRLVFNSEQKNWPHLYVAAAFGANDVRLLTPGDYMVENASVAPDRQSVFYAANTGTAAGDGDRRHLFRVDVESGAIAQLAGGASSEFTPVALADGTIAFDATTARVPPLVTLLAGGSPRALDSPPADFPSSQLVTPQEVSFRAPDGLLVHGQLFLPRGGGKHPAVIFVHGGPPRQMLLTWHYMDYYSNSYAVNQTLANRGFAVLSLNYRLGIGYGHDYNFPPRWGPTGASEYQDVVAGARFLQRDPRVDGSRIGIWGGSYGGYLTALALARNSNIFKAGVDFHGVHDWSMDIDNPLWGITQQQKRYEQFDERELMRVAWLSSPDASIATWRSPVLLIQGDDDRNVEFAQMVDLVARLRRAHVPFEEIVIPNEIHGFLRYQSWLEADGATVSYLLRKLSGP